MICWRCTRPVAKDQAACSYCTPISSQSSSDASYEDKLEVVEHGESEVQPAAQWAAAAPSTYQKITIPVERDSRLMWSGLTAVFFGLGGFGGALGGGGAGPLIYGVVVVGCGILTLVVTRFGARPLYMLTPPQRMLARPGYIIGRAFGYLFLVIGWLMKLFAPNS
jgi:hypothetical protein